MDRQSDQPEQDDSGIEQCAQDLINAIHGHDVQGVAEAMKSAFTILESQPHDESPHTYEDQNALAGEGQE